MRPAPRFPGWRTMTAAQRYNARMSAMFDRAKAQGHGSFDPRRHDNPNCCGNGPHTPGEVRLMKLSGAANLILCRWCWQSENTWRAERNAKLAPASRYDLPTWEASEVYSNG